MVRPHVLTAASVAVLAWAAGPAGVAAQGGAPTGTVPRVLRLEYAAEADRATLRLKVGDPDGQVLGIRLGGSLVAIADGTGCGPRNGRPADWVLPVRRLEPGTHPLQVVLNSSTCTSKATLEESRSDFTIVVGRDGRVTITGQFGDPFVPPGCRVGEERPAGRTTEEEQRGGVRKATPPFVIGCGRLRESRRRFELVAYQQTRGDGARALCIDTYLPAGGVGYGCGTNRVSGGGRIDLTGISAAGRSGLTIVSGATTASVTRVTISFRHRGRAMTRRAALVRVRDRVLLRRLEVQRPFGRYLVEVPRGARRLRVRAYDARGRLTGTAVAPAGLRLPPGSRPGEPVP